jgi:hypothetical protein
MRLAFLDIAAAEGCLNPLLRVHELRGPANWVARAFGSDAPTH